jgi:predicted regulator of Ras-like GTPase activity (Roadblock/LC7/MglB family)/DNA-binding response OmpR family regulator
MKNVLIVDDEKSFLLSLVEGLRNYAAEFNSLTAENGIQALEILRSRRIDLVITDLKMPEMDGFELLNFMRKHYPDVHVMVITAYCTPEIKERLETLGTLRILEKPLDFKEMVDAILGELHSSSRGYIQGITLATFLQLVEMEKKTCTLKIRSKGKTGYLYFSEGELMAADNGTDRNERAAYDIVCWDDAEIEIRNVCREKKSIHKTLGHILMEGFRIKDERGRSGRVDQKDESEKMAKEVDDLEAFISHIETVNHSEGGHDVQTSKEGKMPGLKEMLNEFAKLSGVKAVCLVGRDGFLLDSISQAGIDVEMMGAIASSGFGAAESMGRQLGKGAMSMNMIEFESGPVMLTPVGVDAFIVVVADSDANLGMVRLKLKKHSKELAVAASI